MLIMTFLSAEKIYWPVFVIATLASNVASHATITTTFSIIKQALAHGCFPRVKVVHTSKKFYGQIYIPDINWIVMKKLRKLVKTLDKSNDLGPV